jgi:transcriptional regulator with XRE-family HTH domain
LPSRQTTNHPIAKRLKQARLAMGLSQREVGVRAGIDPSVASVRVNQYERQRHQPAFEVVRRLAEVLKKPTAYFYAVDDNLADLIAAYGQLSAADRASLLAAVRAQSSR